MQLNLFFQSLLLQDYTVATDGRSGSLASSTPQTIAMLIGEKRAETAPEPHGPRIGMIAIGRDAHLQHQSMHQKLPYLVRSMTIEPRFCQHHPTHIQARLASLVPDNSPTQPTLSFLQEHPIDILDALSDLQLIWLRYTPQDTTAKEIAATLFHQAKIHDAVMFDVSRASPPDFDILCRNINTVLNEPGFVGVDLDDLRFLMSLGRGKIAYGVGTGNGEKGLDMATDMAVDQLLSRDTKPDATCGLFMTALIRPEHAPEIPLKQLLQPIDTALATAEVHRFFGLNFVSELPYTASVAIVAVS